AGDNTGNGGGGGSFNSGTNQNNVAGYNSGNGYVTISYNSLTTVCTSLTRTPVAVTVDIPSVEPTSIVSSNGTGFCTVASSVLSLQGGTLGTNADWVWYSGSCGGTLEGTGPTLSISPTSTTTYFVRAESSTGYCANTNCVQITITVSPSGPPAAPITASAIPNPLCQGSLVQLEASAPGNFITWYDAAIGGNSLGSTLSGGQLPITPNASTTYYAEAVFGVFGTPVTETFNYTGAIVPWTVPANVTSITIEGFGAQGGECSSTLTQGARMKGDFNVTPGQQLWLLVGENPTGSNYGGGGTFVGTGSSLALSTPLLVAGGGGGSAGNMGSSALAPIGNDGNASYDGTLGGTLGNGSSSPNGGGGYYTAGTSGGSFVGGGNGGCAFGGGACGSGCNSYGGGGGGYSGGAGDNTGNGGGGGSFNIGTNQSNTPGDHSGHGLLTITYNTIQPICSSLTRTPVSVTVETSSVMPTALTSSLGNCGDGITPTTLSIVGGALGTNADWKWYTGSCGGNLVGSGPSLVVTPTVTTTYYLRSESTGPCPATTCDSITIILVEAPTTVTATPNAFCGAGPFVSQLNATSTGNLINWYDVPSGGIPIVGGASVPSGSNVPVSLSTTTTYYAEAQSIACSNNSLSNIMSNLNTNATAISNTVPNPFNFAMDGGLNGTDIGDGGNDMYDGGNFLNTNFLNGFNYSDNTIISSSAFGTNGQFFTKKIDNMFVMAADLDGVTNFSITGNNGADGSGVADATSFPLTMGCTDYTVYLKRVHSAGDPSINQMIIIPTNPNVVHNFATNTDDTYQELTGLSGTTRMYYLLYASDNGSIIDVVDYTNIATNFLTTVQANIGSTACVSTTRTPVTITVNPSCNTETLELTAFLQGYYTGASTMANVMAAQNYLPVPATNDVDDITVELHDATTFALVPGATVTARLQSDGTALCAIPVQPGNYYVVCKHRNHIETWSADPITFSGIPVPYNFSTSSTQAFAGNMIEVDLGVWAFFSGDINQDGFVDSFDFPALDTDIFNGVNGLYVNTDLNGDGFVDSFDFPIFDANSYNGVSVMTP
ncbi:MAG TPA: hypothetical protein PLU10_08260, partial [Chitinophagaceae bacterium]|nr:hypothetical protein [Chitinophagaceae bacterium]